MIAMTYINKKQATIEAMKDYDNMKHIIDTTRQSVKDEYEDILSISSPQITGMPKSNNARAGEDKLAYGIDKINVMNERYKQAMEYITWFEPAWEILAEEERFILREFYMQGNLRSGATTRISHRLCYSEAHVERLRGKALKKLTHLLYGI